MLPVCGNRGLMGDRAAEGKGDGEGPGPQSRSRWRRKTRACLPLWGSGSSTRWKFLWSLEFAYTQVHVRMCVGGASHSVFAGSAEA